MFGCKWEGPSRRWWGCRGGCGVGKQLRSSEWVPRTFSTFRQPLEKVQAGRLGNSLYPTSPISERRPQTMLLGGTFQLYIPHYLSLGSLPVISLSPRVLDRHIPSGSPCAAYLMSARRFQLGRREEGGE